MAKAKTVWECSQCGERYPKFLGRCDNCGAWNTLTEVVLTPSPKSGSPQRLVPPRSRGSGIPQAALPLAQVHSDRHPRLSSGFGEFDRVLGGGIVPGSLVLIGGDPGIGKSTLLLQTAAHLAKGGPVLYVSGEESAQQIKLRADRLGGTEGLGIESEQLYLLAETELEAILAEIQALQPQVTIIDSIQAIFWGQLSSAPGSVSQVRECAGLLMRVAKKLGVALLIVGHVTKDGSLAGPKVLEHLVDTVLYFEGDRFQSHRLLRAVKNRFGAAQEIGVFEMTASGLVEVDNPSQLFLSSRDQATPGTATIVACEGTRPLVVEVQALVSPTSYSSPRRTATGIEPNRFLQILAVLEKRVGIPLSKYDAYIASAGGIQVAEPAADLGVAVAVAASFRDRQVDPFTVLIGEVGLGGQVRPVPQLEQRLKEAAKLGFRHAIIPNSPVLADAGLRLSRVQRLLEALLVALPSSEPTQ
ncbi:MULTISPECIES: DNA repair protein RadA [unclassified Synechococcus]|uniref:DNA repair protein RadA n=1 Tax=unclassified Synechococcus TaxID=2626047 RepID=UPI0039C3A9DC